MIKNNLPVNLSRFIKNDNSDEIKVSLNRAYYTTNHEVLASDVDTNLSGSTVCTVVIKGNKLYCANVGDSRAIIVKF